MSYQKYHDKRVNELIEFLMQLNENSKFPMKKEEINNSYFNEVCHWIGENILALMFHEVKQTKQKYQLEHSDSISENVYLTISQFAMWLRLCSDIGQVLNSLEYTEKIQQINNQYQKHKNSQNEKIFPKNINDYIDRLKNVSQTEEYKLFKLSKRLKNTQILQQQLQHEVELQRKNNQDLEFEKKEENQKFKKEVDQILNFFHDQKQKLKEETQKHQRIVNNLKEKYQSEKKTSMIENYELTKIIQEKTNVLERLNLELHNAKETALLKENNEKEKTKEIKQKQTQIQKNIKRISELNNELIKLKTKSQQIGKIESDLEDKQKIVNSLKEQLQNVRYYRLFCGQVLNIEVKEKLRWFIDSLENKKNRCIKYTKLIYKMDLLSNVNIHQYIDNYPQIVLLAKLENGKYVGGYSSVPFHPDDMYYFAEGYIFSISNQRVFRLKTPQQVSKNITCITYDENFLIFGNSEIRIRNKDTEFYSNFDISNSYFNNEKEKVNILLGEGACRYAKVENYEIFQVTWQ